ncbi:hypothetical protein QQ008_09705 [Fulvivirgaceae bacterium BMA10]|uniref:Glycosyltransferase subfamily 4-like N-terminal domain-containing protein n=1 Tax=Splendidivirga corallicola TaxID=3051826 RepID=A0ABT8KN46_9BACT|nr:hypothetical protein [Fulvivirgaceae bacterium BMA10]
MKIAYLLSWDLGLEDGVVKKVLTQVAEWSKHECEVRIFCVSKSDSKLKHPVAVPISYFERRASQNLINEFLSVSRAYKKVIDALKDFAPDMIYLRSETYQPLLGKIMDSYPTIVELNTNEAAELSLRSNENFKARARFFYLKPLISKYYSKAAGFICVTYELAKSSEIQKTNKPVMVIPNSIRLKDFQCNHVNDNARAKLVFIGSPDQKWHGVDEIIKLAELTTESLDFEIIGLENSFNSVPSNVRFHGFKKRDEYQRIMCASDIGLGVMGLHRKNMTEACSLKVREYLAFGLPVINGHQDTAFVGKKLPEFILQVPNEEGALSRHKDKVLDFIGRMKGKRLSASEVEEYIDVGIWEAKKVDFFKRIASSVNKDFS